MKNLTFLTALMVPTALTLYPNDKMVDVINHAKWFADAICERCDDPPQEHLNESF